LGVHCPFDLEAAKDDRHKQAYATVQASGSRLLRVKLVGLLESAIALLALAHPAQPSQPQRSAGQQEQVEPLGRRKPH